MPVVTCLTGGLGNQLFQYAMGFSVANYNDDEFFIDVSQFNYGTRKYELDQFNISAKKLDVRPATQNTKVCRMFARIRRLSKTGILRTKFLQEDPDKIYDYAYPKIKYRHSVYLNGFWQNWRYFNDYKELITNELTLKSITGGGQMLIEQVKNEESVAVHVRRGDYVACNGWLINPQFYIEAINKIRTEIEGKLKFYVFCEDKDFANKLFIDLDYEMITGKYGITDVEEFCVMSACKHKIISNSSFSWWAAYLGKQEDSCIVAPVFKQWRKDFYLPNWNTIDLNGEKN